MNKREYEKAVNLIKRYDVSNQNEILQETINFLKELTFKKDISDTIRIENKEKKRGKIE